MKVPRYYLGSQHGFDYVNAEGGKSSPRFQNLWAACEVCGVMTDTTLSDLYGRMFPRCYEHTAGKLPVRHYDRCGGLRINFDK